jgi:hypothetical protein
MPIAATTIKKGPHGYYVDQPQITGDCLGNPIPDETKNPADFPIILKFNQPDCKCPLDPFTVMHITDVEGRKLRVVCDVRNKVEVVSTDLGRKLIEEFTLSKENGFWFFVTSVPLTDLTPKPPKQT